MIVAPLRSKTVSRAPLRAVLFALVLTALLASPLRAAAHDAPQIPPERTFLGRAQVTAVDLLIDVRDENGNVPRDLRPADFEVLEDGEPQRVISVERFSGRLQVAPLAALPAEADLQAAWDWHLVIYVDQVLSSTGSIRRAAENLARQAGDLTRLGTVQIVTADPEPKTVLEPTRSARLVEQMLLQVAGEPGRDAISRTRKRFLDELRTDRELTGGQGGLAGVAGRARRGWTSIAAASCGAPWCRRCECCGSSRTDYSPGLPTTSRAIRRSC